MENLNLHKQKLYSLILAGVGLISLLLPYFTVKARGEFAMGYSVSKNGFGSWGLLVMAGVAAVAVASFMEDKAKPYMGMFKNVALGGFGAMAAGAAIYLIRIMSIGGGRYGGMVKASPGIGLFLGLAAGAAGLLFLLGIVKVPEKPAAPKA